MSEFMYCPECRGEFVRGIVSCNTCEVALVHELPEPLEPVYRDLIPVFSATALAELITVRNLLEAAGISCVTKNEGVQDLFGVGRLTAFNPLIGSVQLLVDRESLSDAREILKTLDGFSDAAEVQKE